MWVENEIECKKKNADKNWIYIFEHKKNRLIINQEKVWKKIYSITIRFLIDEQKEEEEETTKSNAIFDI